MIVKEISKDFWRLELRYGEDRLIWYAPTRAEVRGKYHQWAHDKKFSSTNLQTPHPTIAADSVAYLE